jgi:hypothetical protein
VPATTTTITTTIITTTTTTTTTTLSAPARRPWSVSKGYDTFLPVGEPFPADGANVNSWRDMEIWLAVNGTEKQRCKAGLMIHPIPKVLRYASSVMTLEPGDLVITGTPSGVSSCGVGHVGGEWSVVWMVMVWRLPGRVVAGLAIVLLCGDPPGGGCRASREDADPARLP